jgi:Icc-related predicted phosphoesterase
MDNLSWIHGQEAVREGVSFVGLGGSLGFLSLALFGKAERHVLATMDDLLKNGTVFVTHCPPWGILDKGFAGMHGGSKDLTKLIEAKQPRLHICGHIHEDRGVQQLGRTVIVNCSLGHTGSGAMIDLGTDGTAQVQMLP